MSKTEVEDSVIGIITQSPWVMILFSQVFHPSSSSSTRWQNVGDNGCGRGTCLTPTAHCLYMWSNFSSLPGCWMPHWPTVLMFVIDETHDPLKFFNSLIGFTLAGSSLLLGSCQAVAPWLWHPLGHVLRSPPCKSWFRGTSIYGSDLPLFSEVWLVFLVWFITDSMYMSLSKLGRWWRTGKPGVLQSMGSQRDGQNWVTETTTTTQ